MSYTQSGYYGDVKCNFNWKQYVSLGIIGVGIVVVPFNTVAGSIIIGCGILILIGTVIFDILRKKRYETI